MSDYKLKAKPRKLFGRKLKSLRRQGVIPANVFGKKTKSLAIQLSHQSALKVIREAGETSLINLAVEGESKPRVVLISSYAQDPVTDKLLHIDFHQVDLTVKTTATVPVEIVGESPAVAQGNTLVTLKNELEIEALPADLPESIKVDISNLQEVGDNILAKDLNLDRNKLTLLVDEDETIVTIQAPAKEEVPIEDSEETDGETSEAPTTETKDKSEAETDSSDNSKTEA